MRVSVGGHGVSRGLAVVAVVLVMLLVGVAALAKPGRGNDKPPPKTFTIEGSVDGFLYPGVDETLPIVFVNPINKKISVDEVTVTVVDASTVCTADNVTVGEVPVPVQIGKRGRTTVDVEIVLSIDAVDDCQGAVFPILYEGVATKQ